MASNDGGGPSQSGSRLQFVNVTPATQAEKQRNQKVIRSAAMKTFRRNQKLQRLKEQEESGNSKAMEDKSKTDLRPKDRFNKLEQPRESSTYSESETTLSEVCWPGSLSPSTSIASTSDSGFGISHLELRGGSPSQILLQAPSIISSPMTPLGAGRVDPFRTYPVGVASPQLNEIMDHSITFIWPGFRPISSIVKTKIASAWFEKATERPIVMHALLFGGAVHRDMLRNPRLTLDNPLRLYHKVQTMRLLKESLKNPGDVCMDEVILAVLALSTNEVETMATNTNKISLPFNSPLGSIQWLDVYGRVTFVHAHTDAMRSLVARRGGLEKVELEGLPEVLSLSDILGATQSISKPHFPFLDRWVHESGPKGLGKSHAIFLPGDSLGSGFKSLVPCGLNQTAIDVFEAIADLTVVIDGHCRGVLPISDMALFIDKRNHVQYRLMSLLTGDELNSEEVSSVHMYECIRLTAIIYSAAVIFPLPPYKGIFRKLSTRLKFITEASKFDQCWQLFPKTLLWILVLGGIAALDTEERVWYVQNLAAVSASLNFSEWENVLDDLMQYFWLESACDSGGRLLWAEVERERVFVDGFEVVPKVGNQDFGYIDTG